MHQRQCQLATHHQQERELTQQLLAVRQDSSRTAERLDLQQQLNTAQQDNALIQVDVDTRTVANVIADWTGVPLSSLMKDEQTELLTLENEIGKRVVGQGGILTEAVRKRPYSVVLLDEVEKHTGM